MVGGRKREFNKDEALDAAMRVFWQKGYLAASLTDLTQGMGINKPSMYAAFGNKEALFLKATEHYIEHHASQHARFLSESKPLRQRLKNYLYSIVERQFTDIYPKGCYVSLCVSESASDCMPDQAKDLIQKVSNYSLSTLTQFFEEDEESIKKGLHQSSREYALTLITMIHGTAALAREGKTLDDMLPVIEKTLDMIEA